MALSKTRLADAILTALESVGAYDAYDPIEQPVERAEAIADSRVKIKIITDAIIDELTDNAEISTTVASGITVATTGTAAAQTGSTTATGSGSGGIS